MSYQPLQNDTTQDYTQQPPPQGQTQQPPPQGNTQQPPPQGNTQQPPPQGQTQQPPPQGYTQQPPQGYTQQPPRGYTQQPPPQGYTQQPPPQGYTQQPPQGYTQQPPPQGNNPQYTPQPYAHQPPPYGYQPAPQVMAPQPSVTNNTVVVSQPSIPTIVAVRYRRAPDHLALSIVMMILCLFFCPGPCLVFNIPALIFASQASEHNSNGDYEEAKKAGKIALGLNLTSLLLGIGSYVAGIIAVIIMSAIPRR